MKKNLLLIGTCLTSMVAMAQLPYGTTYSKTHFDDASTTTKKAGKAACSGTTITFGNTGIFDGGFNWDDKYVIIALDECLPASVSFTYSNSTGVTDTEFYVDQSNDGTTWHSKAADYAWQTTSGSTKDVNKTVALKQDTRYIKLCFSGNLAGYFKNIVVNQYIPEQPLERSYSATIRQGSVYSDYLFTNLTEAGNYDTLINYPCCDSLIHFTLSYAPTTYNDILLQVCEYDSINYLGKTYYEAGLYTDTLAGANIYGGDSVLNITVEQLPVYFLMESSITINEGDSATWHDIDLSTYAVGEYALYDSLQTIDGCDSIYAVALTVVMPTPTGMNNTKAAQTIKAEKVLRNGQLFIRREEVLFDPTGRRVE